MYTCDSQECPIAQRRRADEEERARRQAAAHEANQKEFISAEQFRSTRRESKTTLKAAADLAGITPAELCAYEHEREPFPPEIYRGVMAEFLNCHIIEPSEDKYNHIRTLHFFDSKRGHGEDLYKTEETGRVLCRQERSEELTAWCTTSGSGYEADCSVKDGMTMRVVNGKGTVIFEETTFGTIWAGHGLAEKAHPFSWEEEKK